ncbi:DoxX family protein [Metallibacterium sp.]|uniref:DoxX family protein n=1 Tax=Metallibacterium sp. TaxID=2940281 RepID=UPI00262DFF05|nr:DoxX family protein [Metallibacterium sp.]
MTAPPATSLLSRTLGAGRRGWGLLERVLEWLQSPVLLAARLYVAYVFLASGLQSLRDWSATLWLYVNCFQVPLLPPAVAAVAGTAGEIVLPPLLVLGLFGRFGALGLFAINAVALLSYLHTLHVSLFELGAHLTPALMFHFIWGLLALAVALWGPGRWSVDSWRARRRRAA